MWGLARRILGGEKKVVGHLSNVRVLYKVRVKSPTRDLPCHSSSEGAFSIIHQFTDPRASPRWDVDEVQEEGGEESVAPS